MTDFTDEHTKMLIDLLDEGYQPTAIGDTMGMTRNTIIGQRNRHGYHQGHGIIGKLAQKFPDATAREIAEATARDKAPQILLGIGDERKMGGHPRKSIVAAMRATLTNGEAA